MSDKKMPINRANKFFSGGDFSLEISMGREYLEGDLNMVVILYRVDRDATETDSIYGETVKDGVRYFPPVEVNASVNFKAPENKSYNPDGSLRYLQDGQIEMIVYQKHLEELDVDITYGDYIGYPVTETEMRYFSVSNDGKKNYDNVNTIMGYKGAFRRILCAPIDKSEFRGI